MPEAEILDSAGSEDASWSTTNLKQAAALLACDHHLESITSQKNRRVGGRPFVRFIFKRTEALRIDVIKFIDSALECPSVSKLFECYERLQDAVHNPPPPSNED